MAAKSFEVAVGGQAKFNAALLATCELVKTTGCTVQLSYNQTAANATVNGQTWSSGTAAANAILGELPEAALLGRDASSAATAARWVQVAETDLAGVDFGRFSAAVERLNEHLRLRSFIVGYSVTLADLSVADAFRDPSCTCPGTGAAAASSLWKTMLKAKGSDERVPHVIRWNTFIESLPVVKSALAVLAGYARAAKEEGGDGMEQNKPKDQGSMEVNLQNAEDGKVVTRFPPEPSGYLHIGHAKAALLNEYFARRYHGKLVVRFDDTNPSKEKEEFEHAILEDLKMLRITPDQVTWTSDSFEPILAYAEQLIRAGLAYVDDTPVDQMRDERLKSIESKARSLPVDENLKRWDEMKAGTDFGKTCCLRAKIDMKSRNGALRDPVMYRCNDVPHNRTGTKYKLYPTYDFACPIVDSIEGVTHALRTNEYHDRNDQYNWFIDALSLRKPHIWDYSRINFVYTLLSKRKLTWFVDTGRVSGWDDPRFPTIRGILRRGMTVEALKEYILMQGASKNVLLLEWDKIWAINRRIIDPIAPRYTALGKSTKVLLRLQKGPASPYTADTLRHKKNAELGQKTVTYSSAVYLEAEDAREIADNEEVTLMDWGNCIISQLERDATGNVTSMEGQLHLEGDFKKTKKKLTWLSADAPLVDADLFDYGFLITKKKLEEEDSFEDCLADKTEFRSEVVADQHLTVIKKGDVIQLERRGFYICDADASNGRIKLLAIPDGKQTTPARP